jgi:hypothetical protein
MTTARHHADCELPQAIGARHFGERKKPADLARFSEVRYTARVVRFCEITKQTTAAAAVTAASKRTRRIFTRSRAVKNLLLASCLAVAGLFAFSSSAAKADHWDHGGHHGGGWHSGHGHGGYRYSPRYVYRPYPVYRSYPVYAPYPVYRPYPVYETYYYDSYPSTNLFIGGRNFSFGVSGF